LLTKRLGMDNRDVPYEIQTFDHILHTLVRNAMAIWVKDTLKFVMKEAGPVYEFNWRKADFNFVADYTITEQKRLITSAMTPRTMTLYLLHWVLTSERRQLGDIIYANGNIDTTHALGQDGPALLSEDAHRHHRELVCGKVIC